MRERHRYRPVGWDGLEARVALTHGGPIAPGLIGTLSPNPAAAGSAARSIALVNASFNQFTADYLQAQGAYLSSGTAADSTAFKAFTTQEVQLLAQQLTRTLSRVPGSLVYIKDTHQRSLDGNSSVVLQAILYKHINGGTGSGSLLETLTSSSVLPSSPPTGASATLYTLTATNAIQASQVGMINAVKLLVSHRFNNGNYREIVTKEERFVARSIEISLSPSLRRRHVHDGAIWLWLVKPRPSTPARE